MVESSDYKWTFEYLPQIMGLKAENESQCSVVKRHFYFKVTTPDQVSNFLHYIKTPWV